MHQHKTVSALINFKIMKMRRRRRRRRGGKRNCILSWVQYLQLV